MQSLSRLASFACGTAALLLAGAVAAEASPITWMYRGSITSTFDDDLVPLSSPTTIWFTADPERNIAVGDRLRQPMRVPISLQPLWSLRGDATPCRARLNITGTLGIPTTCRARYYLSRSVCLVPRSFQEAVHPGQPFSRFCAISIQFGLPRAATTLLPLPGEPTQRHPAWSCHRRSASTWSFSTCLLRSRPTVT
jgi:hypothetical protein